MKPIATVATVPVAGREQGLGLFPSFGVNAPPFQARDCHGGVERFQASFFCGNGHASLCESLGFRQFTTFYGLEQRGTTERQANDHVKSRFHPNGRVLVAPRAYWKGYLKLSLVSCPISLFPATSEREKISFHQLHKQTGNRIKYKKVDAETGREVESEDIIKGYELSKGEYIELDPEELDAVALESKRVIEIEEFVPKADIDELYLNIPYYIVPDGEVGQQAFAVIREAIRKEGMVAIGKVVFTSREHIIALEARGKGLMGVTLRYPYEVRKDEDYFNDIEDEKIPKDMLELASHIVDTKRGEFDPKKFEDRYEDALKELLKKKQKGEKIERPKEPEPSNVVDLMEALRQSVSAGKGGGARGKSSSHAAHHRAVKKSRSSRGHKKAS
jgi:DNA end-binding protein Ku